LVLFGIRWAQGFGHSHMPAFAWCLQPSHTQEGPCPLPCALPPTQTACPSTLHVDEHLSRPGLPATASCTFLHRVIVERSEDTDRRTPQRDRRWWEYGRWGAGAGAVKLTSAEKMGGSDVSDSKIKSQKKGPVSGRLARLAGRQVAGGAPQLLSATAWQPPSSGLMQARTGTCTGKLHSLAIQSLPTEL